MPEYEWIAGYWQPHHELFAPMACQYFTVDDIYYGMVVEIAPGEVHWTAVREPGVPATALGGSEANIQQAKRQVEVAIYDS